MSDACGRTFKIQNGEIVCVTCCNKESAPLFLITSKPLTGMYYIYEFTDSGLSKIGKGQSPSELEEKFNIKERMGAK